MDSLANRVLGASSSSSRRSSWSKSESMRLVLYETDKRVEVHRISSPALLQYLLDPETGQLLQETTPKTETSDMLDVLKVIDKESKIEAFEIHRSKMGSVQFIERAHHVFMVFQTTTSDKPKDGAEMCRRWWWWSLERDTTCITLQRSRDKDDVKNNKSGRARKEIKPVKENLNGRGAIRDLLTLLWTHHMMDRAYHIRNSNCQTLVTFVSKRVTEEKYVYAGFFKYESPPMKTDFRTKIILKLLQLAGEKHPLFSAIHLESTHLLDQLIDLRKYDAGGLHSGVTLLHYAIVFSKATMVRHLVDRHKVDPAKCDPEGLPGSLHLAAYFAKATDVMDAIFKAGQIDVNQVDSDGNAPLHYAMVGTNQLAVRYLIEKGADPSLANGKGVTPMDVAIAEKKKELVKGTQQEIGNKLLALARF